MEEFFREWRNEQRRRKAKVKLEVVGGWKGVDGRRARGGLTRYSAPSESLRLRTITTSFPKCAPDLKLNSVLKS